MRKVLAAIGALIVVPGGAFLAIASVPTGGKVAIAAGVAWWLVMSALLGKFVLQGNPDLRTPVRATLAVAAVASIVAAFVVTRGNTVDEDIVTAVPAQRPEVREGRAQSSVQNVQVLARQLQRGERPSRRGEGGGGGAGEGRPGGHVQQLRRGPRRG